MKYSGVIIAVSLLFFLILLGGCGDENPTGGTVSSKNQKPSITGFTMSPSCDSDNYLPFGSQTNIGILARDPDGDSLQYYWSEDDDGYFLSGRTNQTVTWKSPTNNQEAKIYEVQCKVSDGELSDSMVISVYIAPFDE